MDGRESTGELKPGRPYYFENKSIAEIHQSDILLHSSELADTEKKGFYALQPKVIELNSAVFTSPSQSIEFPDVTVVQQQNLLALYCTCGFLKNKLCEHQARVIYNLLNREELRIFFDAGLRIKKIKQAAQAYGLEHEKDVEHFFKIRYVDNAVEIKPERREILAVNQATHALLKQQLLPVQAAPLSLQKDQEDHSNLALIFRKQVHYDRFTVELFHADRTKDGKLKSPLTPVDPLRLIWLTQDAEVAKFYTAISAIQNQPTNSLTEITVEALKSIVKNPLNLEIFYHDPTKSEKITSVSAIPVALQILDSQLILTVNKKDPFYEISGELIEKDQPYDLKTIRLKYGSFIQIGNALHLMTNPNLLRVVEFFRKNNSKLLIHHTKFEEFKSAILEGLENLVSIRYSYIKAATPEQLAEQGVDFSISRIIYLSDQEHYVSITPVMKYGSVEIPVLSRKQVYDADQNGNVFKVERDEAAEIQFTSLLIRQHTDFKTQLNESDYFYLHKKHFLDESWFTAAFEEWRNHHITVLGFNTLSGNKLNENKVSITIHVATGIDWFNASLAVKFGKQQASLKQLHKSLRNKSRFVQLDDGTQGILPREWMKKMEHYFQSGEIAGELIRISKNNFSTVRNTFEEHELAEEVKTEIAQYEEKLLSFTGIAEVALPEGLQATLRDYQKHGLNWLNCLDEFNFGACLADDMGLGKTLQILAFLLVQRSKHLQNTNLVIVPTTLLFNWQAEVEKFAPSLRIFTHYANSRLKNPDECVDYEVIFTTYGTLISDLRLLKQYRFNYVILDESQAIKNPESQRYKAVQLLQTRNRIILTGTPVENKTYDLFGQLSFACPGLLGNRQYFRDIYSIPVDQFQDSKRAAELQQKISPFILRRTKKQVATELPEKTEMVIYCEMGAEQRKIYDAEEKELREYIAKRREEDLPKSSMYVLTGITRLRQICNSPALLKDEQFRGDYSSKIEALMEQIESKSAAHKILVFSQFVSMLNLIKRELEQRGIPFEYLTGQTRKRAATVNAFQTNAAVRVFLISLKAGGTGLNLTEADYVFLVDPWWNPAVENQAIDRSYRIGQTKHVIAVRLICPDTIEEKIMKLQNSKTDLANELIKPDSGTLKSFSKKELLEMLGK